MQTQTSVTPANPYSAAHATEALKWLDAIAATDRWNLTIDEVTEVLGGISKRTYHEWKRKIAAGELIELSRDTMERLSLLLGISKALQIIAPSNRSELAFNWFYTPNVSSVFQGQSPKDYIISRGTIESLYVVRRYLDAARG
jgi:hypothetical protein